jgi:hypothetical protein
VELPFTLAFDPPSQAELRAVLRLRRTWLAGLLAVLAIGTLFVVSRTGRADTLDSWLETAR